MDVFYGLWLKRWNEMLNNSKLHKKGSLWRWIFVQIKHVEMVKESAFAGTYFRDIYSDVKSKWYRKS